jgi:hypothetical protein
MVLSVTGVLPGENSRSSAAQLIFTRRAMAALLMFLSSIAL